MNYSNSATSKTPSHIIYVIDSSGSMSEEMPGTKKRKIDFVSDLLEEVAYQIYLRSKRGSVTSERYRLAIFAYNNVITDVTNGEFISVREFIQGVPEFGELGNTATNTYGAMNRVRDFLRKTVPHIGSSYPPPIVCHLTDGQFTREFGNPSKIMQEIMNFETPDGKVLLENIYLGDKILNKSIFDTKFWTGVSDINELNDPYAKFLYDHSSVWPERYAEYFNSEYKFNIKAGTRYFFPAENVDTIKMAFTASASTPRVVHTPDSARDLETIARVNEDKSPTFDISNLFFGSDDAEFDEKNGFLRQVFLKTSIYNRVIKSQRELVIGRKGAGKSAICIMLKNALNNENINTLIITPKFLSPAKIEQSKNTSIDQDELFLMLWKYTLLVSVGRKIYDDSENLKAKSKKHIRSALQMIRSFLVENDEIEKTFLEKISGKTNIFSKFTVKAFGIEGSAETRQLQAQKDFSTELEKFESNLEKVIKELRFANFVVLIDKVDDIWNQTKDSEFMIVGLIKAVHELNILLKGVHFILFLRSDIYDAIFKFNDSDKLHSVEERITWTREDLKHLVSTRGKISLNLDLTSVDGIWNTIFEKQIGNTSSFDYMIDKTLFRPRDIIQYCNEALSNAQNNNHRRIEADDIFSAEKQYSFWKLKDLVSECAVQYPFLEDLLKIFQGFKDNFTFQEFETIVKASPSKGFINSETNKMTIENLLQLLFDTGFIGVELKGKSVYSYDDRFLIVSKLNNFVVHPAFHSALGYKSGTNL